ncbi:uncharacterized protein LOC126784978 isoform X2 [Argentina anserina]|uniref:uncharacterized protein LOC126784978 isoform X2 n=1 Tax=Argentina anserina TaxID=57926 RepID=UPI0021764687|nr:uncharacterized protein LOC126784978 isoform X2 [Potentilla anserina]
MDILNIHYFYVRWLIRYWCSYGPEDYRESDSTMVDGSSVMKPASGKGSRPGRRHMMRGCLCHFTVKRLYTRPLIALIIYNQRTHVDKSGAPCHGILDRDSMGTRAMYAPRISEEQRQKVMSMLYVGIPLDNIVQHHMELVQEHGGPLNRDDFLSRSDVRNMERLIHNSSHELHADDDCSVKIWVQRHRKHVFYFEESSSSESFVLGIQTDWQLQQMLQYGHNSYVAFHSRFGFKKFKFFDPPRNAIPVAWIITSSFNSQDIHKWMGLLAERIRTKDPRWRLDAFLVDDPSYEISIIREAFQCRVLLCIWHVQRAWIKRILKTCRNFDVQREMFKHLGWLLFCTRNGPNAMDAIEEFLQVFVDQCAFMDYFKRQWLPNIEFWVDGIRSLPVASPEPNAAVESYHLRLKSRLFNEQNANSWSRVDWLIHTLTTEFQSSFWLDQYSLETGYFENLRDKSCLTNCWYQALQIVDVDVIIDEQNIQYAKVMSQSNRNVAYTIWNPGSEFSLCDCPWSMLRNICKHIIKVAILCKTRQVARPLLAAQIYRQTLLTLLQNPPYNPVVLDHAILHATRLQQDIKGLEDLSNSGLLQSLPSEINSNVADNMLFPRLP